ncbi:MAG TPA: hypothetical protein VFC63_26590 [Blastocatellia bacterium]|nr:hypothetical protein [Blastocatellia bacterium]
MKICPKCHQRYADEALKFCRIDGAELIASSVDDSATTVELKPPSGEVFTTGKLKNAPSVAVLPFVNNSPDSENEYFCDGLAEEIINTLSKIERLRVVARTSAFSFKGQGADVREIGRTLNVNAILEGSVRKSGNILRITAQLVNVADGYQIWSERYDRELKDVFAIQDEISLAIVDAMKLKLLIEEQAAVLKRYTDNPEVYSLYLKGRYFWNKRIPQMVLKAIDCFTEALRLSNDYALAHAGLADCYALLGMFGGVDPRIAMPKAKQSAMRALEIDSELAEPYATLGIVKGVFDWDWPASEADLKRSIEINPGYSYTHEVYGRLLCGYGKLHESIDRLNIALRLDPLSPLIYCAMANAYYYGHELDQAIAQAQKALDLVPDQPWALCIQGLSYELKGMRAEAISLLEMCLAHNGPFPTVLSALIYAYGRAGQTEEAERTLEQLTELSKTIHVPPYYRSWVNIGLKRYDAAFEDLENAVEERAVLVLVMNVDPIFDPIRFDPRFQRIVSRISSAN